MNALLLMSATVVAYVAAIALVQWVISESKLPPTLKLLEKGS